MKKIIFFWVVFGIFDNAMALSTIQCYLTPSCGTGGADDTCDDICTWCKNASITAPTGYVVKANYAGTIGTSVSPDIAAECNDDGTYSCTCTISSLQTLLCDTGYYGTPTVTYTERYGASFQGCYSCPSSGTTAGQGATAVTECYIPSGNTFTDETGSGEFTGDCYYTN